MQDFGIVDIPGDDKVEITDLDPQDDGSSNSLSIVLLRFSRKISCVANIRAKNTALALLICAIVLLFLVHPDLPGIPGKTSSTSSLATSNAVDVQSPRSIVDTHPAHIGTWIRISNERVIIFQANPGTTGWHYCKVQRGVTLPKYSHPIVVICT